MTDVPVLHSDRLILRPIKASDLDDYARMMADAPTRRFVGGRTLSREESWREMCAMAGHWQLLDYGIFAIEEKTGGALIGRVGPHDPEGLAGEVEIGWMIASGYAGKGYATEAARLAIDWFFSAFDRPASLISLIDKDNAASLAVAKKLGSVNTEEIFTHWQDGPLDIWRLARPT